MTPPKHPKSSALIKSGLFDNLTSFSELERRIEALATEQDRGDALEVFAEAYLATSKSVGAKDVWPGSKVPIGIEQKLGLAGPLGVDGVYESLLGDLCGYQVKFRTGRPSLTFTELSTFMGITDRVDRRVLITNCDDLSEHINDRLGFFCIRGQDLDRLDAWDFDAIRTWLAGAIVLREKFTPKPHQADAIEAIVNSLQANDRTTAVMACGTGKTLVTLWTAERMGSRRVLVLVPSLALLDQILHDWLTHTNWKHPVYISVCSDPTVEKGADELVVKQSDLDFPVDTNPENVRRFLQAKYDGVRIVFSTYHSANIVAEALKGCEPFDLGVFDEAHKTAGREGKQFSLALKDSEIPIRKRLFVTATPRHYDIRKRDKEGDAKLVYSMDVPESYGPRAYTLSFAEAARQGIICNYKVVISIVTTDMLNEELLRRGEVIVAGDPVKARQVANQIALQKAVEETGVTKIITFHRTVDTAKSFTGSGGEGISNHLPDFATDHVRGTMSSSVRNKRMTAFRNAPKAIMSNARCLTEGVDVPVIDMVAFIAPKRSRIDIVQATGRAMRKPKYGSKEFGYILLPIFVEQMKSETLQEALERTDYEEVWKVLRAMQEQDEDLAETIRQMREERGRTKGYDDSQFSEKAIFLGPEISLDTLRQSITARCVENLGDNWDERYGELKAYKEKYGHCNVPQGWPEPTPLGRWVTRQRQNMDSLTKDRVKRLNDFGFVWNPLEANWEEMFEALVEYKKRTGDCNVPAKWAETPKLGIWVNTQRQRKDRLTPDRIKQLNDLGFVWDLIDALWEEMFEALVEYKKRTGDCNVPQGWSENPQLGIWVNTQRQRKDRLTPDRYKRLNDLEIVWERHKSSWEKMFEALVEYKKEYGDCNVPDDWPGNPQLGIWVSNMRSRKDILTSDRVKRLNELGFVWRTLEADWEDGTCQRL